MIIKSLLDQDLYKFSMAQCVLHQFFPAFAHYELIVRGENHLGPISDAVRSEVDALCDLRFTSDDLAYLRGIRYLKPDFVNYLEDFRLRAGDVHIQASGDELVVSVRGPWIRTILLEVPILAIVSEIYMNGGIASDVLARNRAKAKAELLAGMDGMRVADFGTRRRRSLEHQDMVVKTMHNATPAFVGTSNVYLARKYNLIPIGTMAHEFVQAGQALAPVRLVWSQKYMLEAWAREYRGDLGIALTDTICMDAFLRDFDLYLAKLYDGCRHDSGDPIVWGEKLIDHYKKLRIDPMTKTAVFSDGLTIERAHEIHQYFLGRIKTSFGIGTNLTNDCGPKPLSVVMKLMHIDGNPVAKISDEPGKVVCSDEGFLAYLKSVYHMGA